MNDTEAVYGAEDAAKETLHDEGEPIDDEPMAHHAASLFLAEVMDRDGWAGAAAPTLVYDVTDADECERAGWFEWDMRVLHVHPQLAFPWVLLHELAHWLRPPTEGHSPQFCALLVRLVRAGISDEAGTVLLESFHERGVEVNREWLDV